MFDHIEYSVSDIHGARGLYGAIARAVGADEVFFDAEAGELGLGSGGVVNLFLFGGAATVPKMHLCFRAQSVAAVERGYAQAIAAGGVCNGAPGYREHYAPRYFAAFVFDADGHNLELLFRDPAKAG